MGELTEKNRNGVGWFLDGTELTEDEIKEHPELLDKAVPVVGGVQAYGWNGKSWRIFGVDANRSHREQADRAIEALSLLDPHSEIEMSLANNWKNRPIMTIRVCCKNCAHFDECSARDIDPSECPYRFAPNERNGFFHDRKTHKMKKYLPL